MAGTVYKKLSELVTDVHMGGYRDPLYVPPLRLRPSSGVPLTPDEVVDVPDGTTLIVLSNNGSRFYDVIKEHPVSGTLATGERMTIMRFLRDGIYYDTRIQSLPNFRFFTRLVDVDPEARRMYEAQVAAEEAAARERRWAEEAEQLRLHEIRAAEARSMAQDARRRQEAARRREEHEAEAAGLIPVYLTYFRDGMMVDKRVFLKPGYSAADVKLAAQNILQRDVSVARSAMMPDDWSVELK